MPDRCEHCHADPCICDDTSGKVIDLMVALKKSLEANRSGAPRPAELKQPAHV